LARLATRRLGLVRHLAVDVERFWFRAVVAGEQVGLESGDAGWQVHPETSAGDVFGLYRQEIELADAVITATTPGSQSPAAPPCPSAPGVRA
jgi:hypothetical protein